MKTRAILLGGSAALAAGALLYLSLRPSPDDGTGGGSRTGEAAFSPAQRALVERGYRALEEAKRQGDEAEAQGALSKIAQALGGRAGKMLEMAASRNLPIRMYARVIDQHGQGVAGVRVLVDVAGGGPYAPGSGRQLYTTDEDGRFLVDARGQSFAITAVEHPNLAAFYDLNPAIGKKSRALYLDSVGQYGRDYSWRSYATPERSLPVRVVKVDSFESLETFAGSFAPKPNGDGFEWGGIRMTCEREPKDPSRNWREQIGSWAIRLQAIDGGVQETQDYYLAEAPADGYRSEVGVAMTRGQPDYAVRIRTPKFYYWYSEKDGKRTFGALEASFNPYIEDDLCEVRVDGKLSPSGSRNLAMRRRP
jgi:hypothetical protein